MSQSDQEGIAIIGMAGRFPGAAGVDAFWRNLVAGVESISTFSDEELAAAGVDVAAVKSDPNYVRARGILRDAECFDAAFFAMNPREAEVTDPQQRVFLEAAWEAMENAGYVPGPDGPVTGVYAGMTFNTYYLSNLHDRCDILELVGPDVVMLGNEKDYLATRVAYKLNLKGPAINVSTACSTSLVAVGLACQSLLNYQCDMALAGGASVTFPQKRGHRFQEGAITSPDGHTRTFDAKAQGTVFSDGVGVVVLKRVAEALADGDQIYAVIKAVGLNNDGSSKVSFTAPSVDGHAEVIALAQAVAGFAPDTISYIEAHGTATPLGDPIEIAGLTQAFRAGTAAKSFCAIGSVKTNIGHLDAAAGIAGLMKTALSLKHKTLPPTLHFTQPNPQIDFANSPFFVNTALTEWKAGATPRRAGVSSFGTGGTNAHAILEEAPALDPSGDSRSRHLLVLSAKTKPALDAATANLAAHIEAHPDAKLADVAFTLQAGRTAFAHRRVLVCGDAADAVAALRSGDSKRLITRSCEVAHPDVVFLFPGQGAQHAGMGCELYEREPVFRAEVDRCAGILRPALGEDLREVLRGPADRLNQTRFAQPALFVVEYALAKLWMSWGIMPAAMLGHSIGEYVAGCLAGVFSLDDALRLVAARAALVQAQPPGAMLAVRLGESELAPMLGAELSIAAVNSPRLCVASGPFAAIESLEAKLGERGVVARRLATSHAFHSAMMEPVLAPFTALVGKVALHPPRIPYVSNVTAKWVTDGEATDPNYWAGHVRQTVRYAESVAALLGDPRRVLLEVGPGNTLSTFARQQAQPPQVVVASLGEGDEQAGVLGALGRLWLAGVKIDWSRYWEGERRHRVALPAYPFERKRFWVEPGRKTTASATPPVAQVANAGDVPKVAAEKPENRSGELATLFRELSGITGEIPGGVTFLELGFDSLLLTQASLALDRRFGVKVTFRQLLEELSTLDELAAFIASRAPQPAVARDTPPGQTREASPAAAPAVHGPFKPIQREHGAAFTERQQAHLDALISRYEKRTAGSKRLTAEHRPHLADPRSVAGFRHPWKEIIYPIVSARSAGSRIWDVDGNEYVDFIMGFGANLFGHSPDFVTAAVEEQLKRGVEIGPQSAMAGEVARMICELTGAERAGFCNTGSEAVMAALRVARTVTGRNKIVTFAGDYHGVFDEVLVRPAMIDGKPGAAPIAPGIPASLVGNVIVLDYCDAKSLETIRALAPELAAVLVEPVQSRRLDLQPREFLREVRAITEQSGTALILDEIVTGFRVHPGGVQALWGIRADLTTYGKVIGGGFPIGVIAGRRAFMDALDGGAWNYGDDSFPEAGVTFFAGTFVRHPVALAAARAVLMHLKAVGPALQSGLSERGVRLAARLNVCADELGAPLRILNFGSNLFIQFQPEMKSGPLFFFHLREKGIHVWDNRSIILTTAHSDADLDRLASAFRESLIELRDADFLPPLQAAGSFPLTDPQRELWLAARMGEDASRAFNDTFAIHLRGPLDEAALRGAVAEIVGRHDALRATFDAEGGGQVIGAASRFEVPLVDCSAVEEGARRDHVNEIIATEHARHFDLATGPLFRAELLRFSETHHALIIATHHMVVDGWSAGVIFHELKEICAAKRYGGQTRLEPALQYRAYAEWLARPERQASARESERFWLGRFANPPEPVELPPVGSRPPEKTFRAECERLVFDAKFSTMLRQAAARQGCTLTAYLLAGFNVWLHRLSGQRDLVVGVPAAGQIAAGSLANSRALIGHCVHLLPVRTECREGQSFAEYLAAVKTELLAASEHQDFTLGNLIEKLNIRRDAGRTPLVSTTFNIDRAQSGFELPGLESEITAAPRAFNFFDLSVNIIDADVELRADFNFNADIFDRATMRGWMENWRTLLADAALHPGKNPERLELLPEAQQRQMLVEWNRTEREYPSERTVHSLFEEWAARTPDATAVIEDGHRTTYAELNTAANRITHGLLSRGIVDGDLVGLPAIRSVRFIAAILGILKSGGAYVPLDRNEPAERLAAMRTQCRVVLEHSDEPTGTGTENPNPAGAAERPAYVIYTSGSTGVPKGVVVPHRAICRLVVNSDYVQVRADDVVALASNLCFDAATFEIWGALLNGGAVVVTPKDVLLSPEGYGRHLSANRITTVFLTTSLFNQFARQSPAIFRGLRNVVFGGEAADALSVATVLEHGAPDRLVNGYGPTEATTFAVCHVVERVDGARVPIGRPIANTQVFILDAQLQPVPPGVTGELYIGGPGLALGYHAEPVLTAEKFIATPYGRLYRSGDLARWRVDGVIEFLGRCDAQIKLRGFRIEPGEIESALQRHPAVRGAAVGIRDGDTLVAWMVRNGGATPADADLREFLRRRVPAQMIPGAFVWLDALPLTANGKLDQRALPSLAESRRSAGAGEKPRNPMESSVAKIWEQILSRNSFSVHDDFFAVGGHSLLAIRLIGDLRRKFGVDMPVRRLFDAPTIEGIAEYIATHLPPPAPKPVHSLVPIQRGDPQQRAIFLVPGGWGGEIEFLVYAQLKLHLGPKHPIYGLKARGADGVTQPHRNVEEMVVDYVDEIRTVQPHGPYILAGECIGGVLAYEMARRFEELGEKVDLLVLLDTERPHREVLRQFLAEERGERWRQLWDVRIRQPWNDHVRNLSRLPLGEKLKYVWTRTTRHRSWSVKKGADETPLDARKILAHYPRLLMPHHLGAYAGRVTLLIDEESHRVRGNLGWDEVKTGGLDVHVLPGNHLSYIRENAAAAAAKLHELIERATKLSS